MQLDEFRESLKTDHPPRALGAPLLALWYDGHGDWKRAHETVQAERSKTSARVHAYLHRKEGDASNAAYWYSRCGRRPSTASLQDEWKAILTALINQETL